jgi:hypothetical protein
MTPQRTDDRGAVTNRPGRFLGLPARARLGDSGIEDARGDLECETVGDEAPACAMAWGLPIGDRERHDRRAEHMIQTRGHARRAVVASSLSWQVRRISRKDSTIAGSVSARETCLM